MKAIWSGLISFGLLEIPVHLFSAIAEHKFGFKILCGKCHTPLKNIRWCSHCKKEVAWDNVVKGFKKSDGSFFIINQESINKLKPEKIDTITIKEFVDEKEIELLYIDSHYYLAPQRKTDKAFYVLAQALKKSNKVAIGQFIMRERQRVIAISFYKNMLLLNTLHYQYEIRNLEVEATKKVKPTHEELSLALLLINKLSHKKFDLSKYKDTFVEKLKKALKSTKKTSGKVIKKTVKHKEKKASLAASLKESLQEKARA